MIAKSLNKLNGLSSLRFKKSIATFVIIAMSAVLAQNNSSGLDNCENAEHLIAAFQHVSKRTVYVSDLSESLDGDRDGMLDTWELQHGLNPNDPEDAWLDFDYDRVINRTEFINGSPPNCNWTFVEIEGGLTWTYQPGINEPIPSGYQTSKSDGSIISIKPEGGVFKVSKWQNGQWYPHGDLGIVGSYDAVAQTLSTEQGMIVAVVGKVSNLATGLFLDMEIRVRDLQGNLHVIGMDSGWENVTSNWKKVTSLWVTESGYVAGVAQSAINYGNSSIPFRWRKGELDIFGKMSGSTFVPDLSDPVGISEKGEFASSQKVYRADSQLGVSVSNDRIEAIGRYGELWIGPNSGFDGAIRKSLNSKGYRLRGYRNFPSGYSLGSHWGLSALFKSGIDEPWIITGNGAIDNQFDFSAIIANYPDSALAANERFSFSTGSGGEITVTHDYTDPETGGTSLINQYFEDIDQDNDGFTDQAEGMAGTSIYDGSSFPGSSSNVFVSGFNDMGNVVGWTIQNESNSASVNDFPSSGFLFSPHRFTSMGQQNPPDSKFWAITNSGHILASRTEYVPEVVISDIDGDGVEESTTTGAYHPVTKWGVLFPQNDANHNGLPDAWETKFRVSDPDDDPDGDGLTNRVEYILGTHPTCRDTDQDLISDSYEISIGNNPLDPADRDLDNDHDSITNYQESLLNTDGLGWTDPTGLVLPPILPPVVPPITTVTTTPRIEILSGNHQVGRTGQSLGNPIVIRLLDQNGIPVPQTELRIIPRHPGDLVRALGVPTFGDSISVSTNEAGQVTFEIKN